MKRKIFPLLSLAAFSLTLLPASLFAQASEDVFDPGLILPDEILTAEQSMTPEQISAFLHAHSGALKTYYQNDVDGLLKTAAMIIADASRRHHINPQYLLIVLQKEQGLITDPQPSRGQLDWAAGYAACDSCDVDHPLLLKYKGFANQVDHAAWRTRYFIEHPGEFHFQAGGTYTIDGMPVTIQNLATAALYNYTPHLHGNEIFWKLFQYWFADSHHPDGSLLQAIGQPGIWLIKDGERHPFTNETAFTSRYRFNDVLRISATSLAQYPEGAPIKYPEYSLVRIPAGNIYLLAGSYKRWIVDETTFRKLGFNTDEVIEASAADLAFFVDGDPIDSTVLEPLGALLQDPETYGIYYVQNGIKSPLAAPELLSINYPTLRVRRATLNELGHYPKGAPVKLRDGVLVKTPTDPTVYVIANGRKLPIKSEYTFNALGYRWESIQTISQSLMAMHETGDTIQVEPQLTDEQIQELTAS